MRNCEISITLQGMPLPALPSMHHHHHHQQHHSAGHHSDSHGDAKHEHGHAHGHAHGHGHGHGHAHSHHTNNQTRLIWALVLTGGFACIEAGSGWFANSLALISDAGHMITDAAALGLALLAQIISRRPPSARHSFGFGRSQVLAALLNALAMLLVIIWINYEAIGRLIQPAPVNAQSVIIVASIGLAINLLVAWILSRDSENLNMRAALIHVLGDLLGSVAAIIAGVVISYTGWMQIDPLLSILVTLLILKSTIVILRDAYHFLMAGVPHHIDYSQVKQDLAAIDGVLSIHGLHVWEMTPGHSALIGHLEINNLAEWPHILSTIKAMLATAHKIDDVTLQVETSNMAHRLNCRTVNADAPDAHPTPH